MGDKGNRRECKENKTQWETNMPIRQEEKKGKEMDIFQYTSCNQCVRVGMFVRRDANGISALVTPERQQ